MNKLSGIEIMATIVVVAMIVYLACFIMVSINNVDACTDAGYDTSSATFLLEPKCVMNAISIPLSEVYKHE